MSAYTRHNAAQPVSHGQAAGRVAQVQAEAATRKTEQEQEAAHKARVKKAFDLELEKRMKVAELTSLSPPAPPDSVGSESSESRGQEQRERATRAEGDRSDSSASNSLEFTLSRCYSIVVTDSLGPGCRSSSRFG